MANDPIGAGWHKVPYDDVKEYIEYKIKLLRDDFYINLSGYDYDHFRSMKTISDVDAYAHQLLNERL